MRDEPLKKCPQCKKAGLKRLVGGGAGLIFKGTGFYITDYKNKGTGKSEAGKSEGGGADAGGKSDGAKPAETKASSPESKPAAPGAGKSAPDKPKGRT